MNIISQLLEKKIVPVILITFIAFLTLGTSVMGAVKVAGSFDDNKTQNTEVPDLEVEQEGIKAENSNNNIKNNSTANSSVGGSTNGKLTNSPSQGKSALGAQNTLGTSSNINSNACIVTIFGKQYDVTSLRSSHPGGDVFVCGADQSSAYQGAHGTSVSRLAKYLVTAGSSGSNSTNTGAGMSGSQNGNGSQQSGLSAGGNRRIDDDNDDEMEDEDDDDDSGKEENDD